MHDKGFEKASGLASAAPHAPEADRRTAIDAAIDAFDDAARNYVTPGGNQGGRYDRFSDVFDLSYEFWGDSSGADQVVERGDLSTSSFSVWWLRQEQLVAAFTMNRPDEEREAAQKWIASKQRVSAEVLRAPRLAA